MATPLEALQNTAKLKEAALRNSSTAYTPNTDPTRSDISTATQLASVNKQIEDLRSTQIRNKWYGPSTNTTEDTGESDGMIMGGLKALARPLNAIAGTAQYVLGKGTESDLASNINTAMKTGLTFGNIIQQSGAPKGVSMPLGFALDVMFDPVNWLTAGTAALIPRVGTGLVKGAMKKAAVEGATEVAESGLRGSLKAGMEGLTSNLSKKAATAMDLVPFAKGSSRYKALAEKVSEKALTGAEKYDKLIGTSVWDRLGKAPLGYKAGLLGETIEKNLSKTPLGAKAVQFFKYSPQKAAKIAELNDQVINLAKDKGILLERSGETANFATIADFEAPNATITIPGKVKQTTDGVVQAADEVVAIRDSAGKLLPEFQGKVTVHDTFDNAQALLESAAEDYNLQHLVEAYKVTPVGKTGVQWYDDAIEKLKNVKVGDVLPGQPTSIAEVTNEAGDLLKSVKSYDGVKNFKPFEKILGAYPQYLSIFKGAKVPMNAASHIVANIGNLFMGAMEGLPVYKPAYIAEVWKANKLVRGKLTPATLKKMIYSDLDNHVASLMDMAETNPSMFRKLGVDPAELQSKLSTEQKIRYALGGASFDEAKSVLKQEYEAIDQSLRQTKNVIKSEEEAIAKELGRFKTGTETVSEMAEKAPVREAEMPGTWATGELTPNKIFDEWKKRVAAKAMNNPNNPAYRAANTLINSMPRWYEQIDQSWKLGTVGYLSRVGLNEQELITVSRSVPIFREDVIETAVKNGEKLYRLSPLKATEVATETFMDYSAMPDFVKVMRALPIVGSPFFSFPYAMLAKSGKTLVNNPAAFNKIGFLLNEISGLRTPEEKAAMQEKYNQYLNSPTVIKLFGMWNTNVKNYIPYYTMNMFNPSERTYGNSTNAQILKMTDKFPAFQDPVGAVIKDYFIQPWILSGSGEVPQGQFGQPLYPSYDEAGKKINVGILGRTPYALRTLAESAVPGTAAYAGILNAPIGAGPEVIDWLPSYGARNLANATQGRSSVGAMTKEDAVRKTLRSLFGRTGIPLYTLDTTQNTFKK